MGGEFKFIHKFETLRQKSKISNQVDRNSIFVGIEHLNGDWIW